MKRYIEKINYGDGATLYKTTSPLFTSLDILKKLCEYEDLEEQAAFLTDGKLSIENILDCLRKTLQGDEEEFKFARILTNAEAEKWDKWKSAEEQGRLIILPCKIGDSVYWINNGKLFNTDFCLGDVNLLGKTIFLTQEAAEAALKESEQE